MKAHAFLKCTHTCKRMRFRILLVLVGWITTVYWMTSPDRCSDFKVQLLKIQKKLKPDTLQENLQQQNAEFYQEGLNDYSGFSNEYESLRRRIYSNTKELYYFIEQQLTKSPNKDLKPDEVRLLLRETAERKRSLLSDVERLSQVDGHEAWRRAEADAASDLVQRRLLRLQHPPDCRAARKLLCDHDNCGFGCQHHHIVYCLIVAYATERTLILTRTNWRYSWNWEDTFYPLSTCNSTYDERVWKFSVASLFRVVRVVHNLAASLKNGSSKRIFSIVAFKNESEARSEICLKDRGLIRQKYLIFWKVLVCMVLLLVYMPLTFLAFTLFVLIEENLDYHIVYVQADFSDNQNAKVVSLPLLYHLLPKPKYLPLAVPEDLADRISSFNGDPSSWWIAQMIKFILKPRAHVQKSISDAIASMGIKLPFVGVHVRRTDKIGTEAEYHDLKEYMSHVEEYYSQRELTRTVRQRRVYVATDDAKVLKEARQKYPRYKFYGDPERASSAATHWRYKPPALTNLLVDLHVLAMSNYLVCTFSSQFCLLVYEMMQANRVDASNSFFSLDDQYHFVGQNPHSRIIVGGAANTSGVWTAFKSGDTMRDGGGLIPWYKTADYVDTYPFPEFQEVPLFTNDTYKVEEVEPSVYFE